MSREVVAGDSEAMERTLEALHNGKAAQGAAQPVVLPSEALHGIRYSPTLEEMVREHLRRGFALTDTSLCRALLAELDRVRGKLAAIGVELLRPDSERKYSGQEYCIRQHIRDGQHPGGME